MRITVRHHIDKRSVTPLKMIEMGGYVLPEAFEMTLSNDDDAPNITVRFRVRNGRVECSSVTVEAQSEGREVQTQDFRAVRVGHWLEQAVRIAASPIRSEAGEEISFVVNPATEDRGAAREVRKNRRKVRVTPERLREVADLARTSDDPVAAVEDLLGIQARAAQLWIKRARDHADPETGRPYLEPASGGH